MKPHLTIEGIDARLARRRARGTPIGLYDRRLLERRGRIVKDAEYKAYDEARTRENAALRAAEEAKEAARVSAAGELVEAWAEASMALYEAADSVSLLEGEHVSELLGFLAEEWPPKDPDGVEDEAVVFTFPPSGGDVM